MTQIQSGTAGDTAAGKFTYSAALARTVGQILSLAGVLLSKGRG